MLESEFIGAVAIVARHPHIIATLLLPLPLRGSCFWRCLAPFMGTSTTCQRLLLRVNVRSMQASLHCVSVDCMPAAELCEESSNARWRPFSVPERGGTAAGRHSTSD